jgi:hypothetical protein
METAASTVTRIQVAAKRAADVPLLLIVEADDRARRGCAKALARAGYRCHQPALVLLGIPLAAAGVAVADTIALFAGCPQTTSIPVLHLSTSKALLAEVRRILA